MITTETKDLLLHSRWTNPTDLYIGDIIEYDMSDGGFSIIREENLLPPEEIRRLERIPKGFERNDAVGKLKYSKNPTIRDTGKKLEKLFGKYRVLFGFYNDVDIEDIFSIKRDAVFLTRHATQTEFGKYIKFKDKHHYDIYFLLGKDALVVANQKTRKRTYEIYYDTFTDDVAVKGIKDEIIEQYHMDSIMTIIKKYLRYVSRFDYEGATKFIVKVIDDYKFHRLPIGCYREFNDQSCFKFQIDGKEFATTEADMSMISYIDIRHNFNNVLVPMLNMASMGIGKDNRKSR